MVAAAGYQKPAASICLDEKADTIVEASIATILTSSLVMPAACSARVRIMSPEVPSGTPTVLPRRSAMEVMPG
jgi:hypothetical protein